MDNTPPHGAWEKTGRVRRFFLLALTILPSLVAGRIMYGILPTKEGVLLNSLVTLLFAVLFGWIAMGFWSAAAGIVVVLRRYDRFMVTAGLSDETRLPPGVRSAILFPVYNEDAQRVLEGVRTVWRSLCDLGARDNFDIYILSDSTNAEAWVNEEEAWHNLCREEGAFNHIFYRHRQINRKGKSGNVADFCRRWGANYPYMIVFDADSLMSGKTLVNMVRIMEARPDIGILQTAPKSINSKTLLSRIQQFSNHLYGPVFAAGLHYWQLGDAQYWGHNAILRIEPFMRYCHLPVLPGPQPLGGPILSHDFVEAALMRRAGYGVWLAYELDGSYEENPPSLIDELIRDRRWCQGNLQHSRLILARGIFPTHRALFINGIMSYVSALLWFFFLIVSSVQAVAKLFILPEYFSTDGRATLFPEWPQDFTNLMLALFGGTAMLLFLPKLFTLFLVIAKGGAAAFGGAVRVTASVVAELVVSTLLAPVRMLFHSLYVVSTLLGFTVRWNAQNRDSDGLSWRQAIRFHWWGVVLGIFWGGAMYVINPGYFLWLSPIIAGLIIAIPLSVWTSRARLGAFARRCGLFLTPPETMPAPEIASLDANLKRREGFSPFAIPDDSGFVRAVVVPHIHALHRSLAYRGRKSSPEKVAELELLIEKAVAKGPGVLSRKEKNLILGDPDTLTKLHRRVWTLDSARARQWGIEV